MAWAASAATRGRAYCPYRLTFDVETVRVEPMKAIEGVAHGELAGRGVWKLEELDGSVIARYDWNVETTKSWMNLISPLARPLFKWNHDVIMGWGAEGLAGKLGTAVIEERGSQEYNPLP